MKTPLDAIYDMIPDAGCKGLCQASCGPIPLKAAEVDHIRENGYNVPGLVDHKTNGKLTCSHLTDAGKCGIYACRPLICRMFGVVEQLRCPHGCVPKEGFMPEPQAKAVFQAITVLSGGRPTHYPELGKKPNIPEIP